MSGQLQLGRDPAAVVETGVQIVLGVVLALSLGTEHTNALSAAVVALGGVLTSFWVARDKLLPALTGFIKAAFALALTLGAHLEPSVESGIIMIVSAAATAWLRTQVTAPIAADGTRVPKLAVAGADGVHDITSLPNR